MAKMSCREVGRRLQSYLDGELDADRIEKIRAHLDDCRACGLEAETFEQIKRDLHAQKPPADSAALERLRAFSEQIAERAAHAR